ncbi:MAG: hypothetical protein ACR2RL_16740 [Gammaproteobacteria bacterium]
MQSDDAATDHSLSTEMPPMMRDVWRQPDVLEELAGRSDEIAAFAMANLVPDHLGCCIAFGSGDGWFAARIAGAASVSMSTASGLDLLAIQAPLLEPMDRGLAISMSGNVDRTVEAAQALIDRGVKVCLLTNGGGGRLGTVAGPALSLELAQVAPFLCGTSSFTATLAALRICTAAMEARTDTEGPRIVHTAKVLREELTNADVIGRTVADAVRGNAVGVRMLSAGTDGLGLAEYGAAKLVELTRIPVWADDIEEFAHRQFWSAASGELIVYCPTNPAVAEVAASSSEALRSMGFRTLAVGPAALINGSDGAGAYDWAYGFSDNGTDAAILTAVALQLLAYHLSIATGLDPNRRAHLQGDAERFRVSRLLTRQSLVGSGT